MSDEIPDVYSTGEWVTVPRWPDREFRPLVGIHTSDGGFSLSPDAARLFALRLFKVAGQVDE